VQQSLRLTQGLLFQIAVFAAHLGVAILGIRTQSGGTPEPIVWLPLGVALGVFIIGGLRFLPAVLAASLIGTLWIDDLSGWGRVLAGIGGALAPAVAVWLLKEFSDFSPQLDRVRDLSWLLAINVPLASLLQGVAITLAFVFLGAAPIAWMPFFASWTLAAAVGATILTPTMLLVWGVPHRRLTSMQWWELATIVGVLTIALTAAMYLGAEQGAEQPILGPLAAMTTLPLAILAALRFDRLGAGASGLVASTVLLAAAVLGVGPFDRMVAGERLHAVFGLWGFVLALQAMAMLLGVAVAANRRQTAELQSVAARLRLVVDAARLGYWQFDRDGVTTHTNARLAAMLGTTEDALLGRTVLDIVAEHNRAEARRRLDVAIGQGGADIELECTRRDGSSAWLALHLTTLLDGGVIAAVEDLAERRRDEAERLRLETNAMHAQRLESLGVLSGGVAHDFNNIVMGIRGNAELLRKRGDLDPAAVRDSADKIDAACQRAAGLVDTLLAYAGRGPFTVERLSLAGVVRDAVEIARLAAPRGVHVAFDAPNEDLFVDADPHHLRQMLVNIVANAVEAIGTRGGLVRIFAVAARETDVDDGPVDRVHITINDDGCGMDAATSLRVFEPFFTTKGMGRGLGMSAALGIARRLGGTIEVHSRLGVGTSVRVVLPLAAAGASQPRRPDAGDAPLGQRPLALVVEPEISVRELITAALQVRGYSVGEERSLESALAASTRRSVALVVAGGRSVIGTLDVVRQARMRGCEVPLVLTSEGRDTIVLHPTDRKTTWLARPFGVREFLAAVDEATIERALGAVAQPSQPDNP
jgi:PAS domain S-box-containing protein